MLAILSNRTYRHLFAAQVIALIGTGLATIALGLLAWNLAGDDAGLVLGTALALAAFGGGSMIAALFLPSIPIRSTAAQERPSRGPPSNLCRTIRAEPYLLADHLPTRRTVRNRFWPRCDLPPYGRYRGHWVHQRDDPMACE